MESGRDAAARRRVATVTQHLAPQQGVCPSDFVGTLDMVPTAAVSEVEMQADGFSDEAGASSSSHHGVGQHDAEIDITVASAPAPGGHATINPVAFTLLFDQGFFSCLRAIELLREAKPSTPIIIGVAGPIGSGKTLLSQKIASAYGSTTVLELGNFVFPERARKATSDEKSIGDPSMTDFALVRQTIAKVRAGEMISVPRMSAAMPHLKGFRTLRVPSNGIVILEGAYALHSSLRPLYNISVSINGGVHLDLIKRIMRDIRDVRGDRVSQDDALVQITSVVFPMFKAFIEPDLKQAQIRIFNNHNPIYTMADPTLYVAKTEWNRVESVEDEILCRKPSKSLEWSDMYLFPPRYDDEGKYRADRTSWIRIRRLDGTFFLYFYNEIPDAELNTRPGILFKIGVRSISGIMSLGYQIGAIMHRTTHTLYDRDDLVVTKDFIPELQQTFVQVKGVDRAAVRAMADRLGITKNHIRHTMLYLYFKRLREDERAKASVASRSLPAASLGVAATTNKVKVNSNQAKGASSSTPSS